MKKSFLAILALAMALGVGTPLLSADDDHRDDEHHGNGHGNGNGNGHGNGNGNGHGHGHGNKHHDRDDDHDRDRGRDNDQGWERRDGYEYRAYADRDGRPPGWNQGRKTGWKNCGLPPGEAKKYGCRTYTYQGRPHYYYQDEVGRIVIRRPIIRLHAGVDIIP